MDQHLQGGPAEIVLIYRHCVGGFVHNNAEGIIAIFTIILALSTIFLWAVTRDLAKNSEQAITELERPYVFILDYNWLLKEKAKANDAEYGWVYYVMNGGKLPAFIKRVTLGSKFGQSIPAMDDAGPLHDLLTAPVVGGGEKREIIQKLQDESGEPVHECEIRGGMATIPGCAFMYDRDAVYQ